MTMQIIYELEREYVAPELRLDYEWDDGGRSTAGYKGTTGDCAVRAIAIATDTPYQTAYDRINDLAKSERTGKRKRGVSSARGGVYRGTMHKYLTELGWEWVPTMFIGQGCKVHMRKNELPDGPIILNLSRHFCAVIDKTIYDTHNPSRGGTRCVYGYWQKKLPVNKQV